MTHHEKIWYAFKEARKAVLHFSENALPALTIHEVHFVPIDAKSSEIYIFFQTDAELEQSKTNGNALLLQQRFILEMEGLGFGPSNGLPIRFEFDSHENVIKNYEGSYFFRLR